MAETTDNQGFPFPEGEEPPNGPLQIGALAQDLDDKWPIRSRGKCMISGSQTVGDTFGTWNSMGTPDKIEDLVLPEDGLLFAFFQSQFKSGKNNLVAPNGNAGVGLFLNGNLVTVAKQASTNGQGKVELELNSITAQHSSARWAALTLENNAPRVILPNSGNYSHAANGTALSAPLAPVVIFASAGTYSLEMKYKTDEGISVSVQNRKFWAWTMPF